MGRGGTANERDNPVGAAAVDAFYERLRLHAATIDELLSAAIAPSPGGAGDTELAARRLSAWRRAAAAGDEALFARRLKRDGLAPAKVRERLAAVALVAAGPAPAWLDDAVWIEGALRSPTPSARPGARPGTRPGTGLGRDLCAFEELLLPVVDEAEARLWQGLDAAAAAWTATARAGLAQALLEELSGLGAPAIYQRFAAARDAGTPGYDQFVAAMKAGGFRRLFEDKPVLLRLFATLTRQWIETSREFVGRLAADMPIIRREFLQPRADARIAAVEGELSDPHHGGRSVRIVTFADGARIVYKPKDLRLDVAWHRLIERLNRADAPIALQAVRALDRDGYGWTEFIDHAGCADAAGCARFFRRAGGWLALLHLFAATDMHQENMIAHGEHPVPVDLETILQPTAEEHKAGDAEGEAFDAAMDIVANSVMTVGLLPAYGHSVDNNVFVMGGMTPDWGARTVIAWTDVNSDAMRPAKAKQPGASNTNLPHVGGRYAKFADHIDGFVAGFADYAKFLLQRIRNANPEILFDGFAGVAVRRVIRPTRFYDMLLRRLKDHRSMDDGALWSAQADFMSRLAEWDKDDDPLWPLQRAERDALLALNVPHFTSPSDGSAIGDGAGIAVRTDATPGLARARARLQNLDDREIAWQIDVIGANTNAIVPAAADPARQQAPRDEVARGGAAIAPTREIFIAEADRIAAELSRHAIRRGPGAAWIGLDWLGDSEVCQLVCLGPDLYNGTTGIAVFLAAHAAATGSEHSAELALAAIARLRRNLKSRNAARMARLIGIGGATGLGSIVYALTAMAKGLGRAELRADAAAAVQLFTDELIAADRQLDVMGGSAGAILALLRLYRDGASADALDRAGKCGEHLLAQPRRGANGRRSFLGQGLGSQALNGMSHGAAGFAYALAALAAATGRQDFADAAAECMAYEDSSYDPARHNWPDLRNPGAPAWPCQWCHGAPGIGLARLGTQRRGGKNPKMDAALLAADIGNAVIGVEQGPPGEVDTLCCGTLGRIEFICEAAGALGRSDLRALAARRLSAVLQRAGATGDYRWNAGKRQFNLGLFRGLAGVGYTLLRQAALLGGDAAPPNVLIWE